MIRCTINVLTSIGVIPEAFVVFSSFIWHGEVSLQHKQF